MSKEILDIAVKWTFLIFIMFTSIGCTYVLCIPDEIPKWIKIILITFSIWTIIILLHIGFYY